MSNPDPADADPPADPPAEDDEPWEQTSDAMLGVYHPDKPYEG